MLYVLCACPLDVGIVCVFLRSVFPLNVEGYVMNTLFCCNCILLTFKFCPVTMCLLGEGLRGPPPCIILVSKLEQLPYA